MTKFHKRILFLLIYTKIWFLLDHKSCNIDQKWILLVIKELSIFYILSILLQSPFYLCCFHLLVEPFFYLHLILIYSKLFSMMKNIVKYIRKQVLPLVDFVITTKNHYSEVYISFKFIADIARNLWIAICGSTLSFHRSL